MGNPSLGGAYLRALETEDAKLSASLMADASCWAETCAWFAAAAGAAATNVSMTAKVVFMRFGGGLAEPDEGTGQGRACATSLFPVVSVPFGAPLVRLSLGFPPS